MCRKESGYLFHTGFSVNRLLTLLSRPLHCHGAKSDESSRVVWMSVTCLWVIIANTSVYSSCVDDSPVSWLLLTCQSNEQWPRPTGSVYGKWNLAVNISCSFLICIVFSFGSAGTLCLQYTWLEKPTVWLWERPRLCLKSPTHSLLPTH